MLEKKNKAKRPRKPPMLPPKSERDGPFCRAGQGKNAVSQPETPVAWRGGRKQQISTEDYFCPHQAYADYGIQDAHMHALVGYGTHGKQEVLQDFQCPACGKKLTPRRNTIRYRLKSHAGWVAKIVWLLAVGVDASAVAEGFGVREITMRTCLCRSGIPGEKRHERFMAELERVHVQRDERWANGKDGSQDMGLWVAAPQEWRTM